MWRLVFGEDTNISYEAASQMDIHELMEANAAYDLYLEAKKKSMKSKKKGGAK
ncbi:hypothetical protein [Fictibacillus phosphorivorans]|uniref:hypothetical protein n=1 Tax=Fictibacillus phosphorivorans TaxID=1221500 RepID=UPI000ACCA3B0|nr:hypothetical protein [Fictibacillus phosphorivorans]